MAPKNYLSTGKSYQYDNGGVDKVITIGNDTVTIEVIKSGLPKHLSAPVGSRFNIDADDYREMIASGELKDLGWKD
jgi:hypothetical protein